MNKAASLDAKSFVSGPPSRLSTSDQPTHNPQQHSRASLKVTPEPPASFDQPTRPQSSASLSDLTDKSARKRSQGRLLKLKADLRALAGRWDEAAALYNEALAVLRTTGDDVWHAAALECTIMLQVLQTWTATIPEVRPSLVFITQELIVHG